MATVLRVLADDEIARIHEASLAAIAGDVPIPFPDEVAA